MDDPQFDHSFQLIDVHIDHLLISGDENFKDDPQNIAHISVEHDIQWAFRFEEEELAVRFMVYIDGLNSESEELGVKLELGIVTYLGVEFLQDYVLYGKVEEGQPEYQVDPVLSKQVLDNLYPMIRGIVLERTRGALLGPILLPIQSLDHLIHRPT